MQGEALTEDPLFLACTRPAMWRGVPVEALSINLMFTGIVFIIMSNPFYLLIGVIIHYTIRAIISRDYNVFTTIKLWMDTKARALNTELWGGSSVSPMPLRPAQKPREVRTYV